MFALKSPAKILQVVDKIGDIVELKFDMPVVAHTLDHHVAFTRGPVLLARDSRFADGDLMEPFRRGIKDGQIMPTLAGDTWMRDNFYRTWFPIEYTPE